MMVQSYLSENGLYQRNSSCIILFKTSENNVSIQENGHSSYKCFKNNSLYDSFLLSFTCYVVSVPEGLVMG